MFVGVYWLETEAKLMKNVKLLFLKLVDFKTGVRSTRMMLVFDNLKICPIQYYFIIFQNSLNYSSLI